MFKEMLRIARVRKFFEVNGMDTKEGCTIQVADTILGHDYCTKEEVYRVLGSYWSSLYPDLITYCEIDPQNFIL